jgi:hypothetical protein
LAVDGGFSRIKLGGNSMALKTIGRHFRKVCLSVPFSVALSGIGVLAYQGTIWLRLGYWQSLGSRSVLYRVLPSGFLHWLHNPKSWLGLKKMVFSVFNLPLALFLLLFGLAVFLLATMAFDLFFKFEKTGSIDRRRWRCI